MTTLSSVDTWLLVAFNSMVPPPGLGQEIFKSIGENPLIRGFPVFFSLAALWFSKACCKRRSRMLIGVLAACAATVLSVWMQSHFATHTRPFLDPALHLQGIKTISIVGWDHFDSFPSDTATLFFALATVIFLENRIAGSGAFLWSLITTGVARIAMGWHYPSDIAGGLLLGVGCVYLLTRFRPLEAFLERVLRLCEPRLYVVHALLFLFLADAYTTFTGLQDFYRWFGKVGAFVIGKL